MTIHAWFDLAATAAAALVTVGCFLWRLRGAAARIESAGAGYAVALVAGAVAGGYALGTANLRLSGAPAVGRSIVGALAGAIAAVEIFKRFRGIRGSTGVIFVPGFCASVVIGRWGCFLSGLEDQTHGTPTSLPWGHDFGDGIPRHPVQLYESFVMGAFLALALYLIGRRDDGFLRNGFYLMVLAYAGQRFLWEFLKPYAPLVGSLNLFHFLCTGLVIYSIMMIARARAA